MKRPENIKLIALDIDGTIMDENYHISDRVKEAIINASQKGIKVVLATGRIYKSAKSIVEMLQLDTPIISYHGSLVKDDKKEYVHHKIDSKTALELVSGLRKFDLQINTFINDELIVEKAGHHLIKYAKDRSLDYKVVESFESIENFNPTKIMIIDKNTDFVYKIRDVFRKTFSDKLYITKSTPVYCEFLNNKANKGNAILHLAKIFGFKQSEIMVAGDQDNDREMFEVAGFSVAMGNAVEEIKSIADFTADTVNNDGVAKVIEDFVL
jgi:hypothetical protein